MKTEDIINGLKHMADDHPCCRETVELTIRHILERESELRQAQAMLKDDSTTEDKCEQMLEPLVGYDRNLPYVLRLPAAIRRLANNGHEPRP